ncbi:MAG: metallophosphoesterase family protein [Dehalococcoidia bacterium]|nr:metallophosphoesterase family protein [Dehalococcoidia bacterium]
MRVLIVSDIHANLVALETVLRDAAAGGPIGALWNLGDCVGYGPRPGECIARLREMEALWVAGNHERACTGAIGTDDFNPDAAAAAQWTKQRLSPEERAFLDTLPEVAEETASDPGLKAGAASGPVADPGLKAGAASGPIADPSLKAGASRAGFTLVHGTLRQPIWEYLYSHEAAMGHLQLQRSPFGLVGHTHVPLIVIEDAGAPHGCELYRFGDGESVELSGERRLVINPGSVGQPRDGDPRAAYAVYDTESAGVTLHRVEYEIATTQKRMEEEELPRRLIDRLTLGR